MTTATRPLPEHGTRARYLRRCDCQPCSDAHYRYMARWRLDDQRGQRRRIEATPARDRATTLHAAGWSMQQIADAARCSRRSVQDLLSGTTRHLRRDIAARILAIPADQPIPSPPRDVDATGTVRRLRALVAIGYPIARIAAAAGLHRDRLTGVARGRFPQVRLATAEAVASVYRTWSRVPGDSGQARAHARRNGWLSPAAWGDDIDDPAAKPERRGILRSPAPDSRRSQHIRAEILHLAALGESVHQIHLAIGRSEHYVHDVIRDAS